MNLAEPDPSQAGGPISRVIASPRPDERKAQRQPDVLPASLSRQENGLSNTETHSKISYPEGGLSRFVDVEQRSFWFRHRNRCITAAVSHYPPQGAIVDVGAGTGYVASGLRDAGFEVIAVEPHIDGALIAHRRGLENVFCGSFDDIGFAPSSIAALGLFDVLEHIEDDIGTLARFRDVLKPDGRLYITVPSYNFLFSSEDLTVSHFRRYTVGSCSRVLERAGFVTEYHSYLFMFSARSDPRASAEIPYRFRGDGRVRRSRASRRLTISLALSPAQSTKFSIWRHGEVPERRAAGVRQ